METRIAIIGIIVEDLEASDVVNRILHEYAPHIIGRMGIPHRQRSVNIISVVLDAPGDVINTLAGRLGRIRGVSAKTLYSRN